MKTQHFLATVSPQVVGEADGALKVRTLAFVEGKQKPVKGRASTKTKAQLETYVANTNNFIESGEEVPFFESSHDMESDGYTNRNKIGLQEGYSAEVIKKEDLPNGKFSDLIGKTGVFCTTNILDEEAIARYKKGLIKKISVGIGNIGHGLQFFEHSAVPWGAVRGAQLFGHPIMDFTGEEEDDDSTDPESKEADETNEPPKIYALTIDGAMAERDSFDTPGMDMVRRLTGLLRGVLTNIKTTSEAELLGRDRQQLMAAAVDDFTTQIRQDLGLTALTPVPATGESFMFDYTQSLDDILGRLKKDDEAAKGAIAELSSELSLKPEVFVKALSPADAAGAEHYGLIVGAIAKRMSPVQSTETNAMTPEIQGQFASMRKDIESFSARAEKAEGQLAQVEERRVTGDRYMRLKTMAGKLNADGKLTANQFRGFFPETEQFSAAVERFIAAPTAEPKEGEEAPPTLDTIEAQLKFAATLEPRVQLGSVSGDEPLAGGLSGQDLGDMERFIKTHPEMSEDEKKERLAALRPTAA